METEILQDGDGCWTLYVNGWPEVVEESYTVCCNVQYALQNPEQEWGECGEVAEAIRKSTKEKPIENLPF